MTTPAAVQARLARFATTHARTSLLSVPSALTLAAVGFEPVGEVMGCSVRQLTRQNVGSCGRTLGRDWAAVPVRLSSQARSPFHGYAETLRRGFGRARQRLVAEAQALGADGVIRIRLNQSRINESCHEFTAFGTAVRARSRTRPGHPFTTDLAGPDLAALLLAGWVPVALQVGIEVAVRHDDPNTEQLASRLNSRNVEIRGYTELITKARASARGILSRSITAAGADGGLLSRLDTATWEHDCDHVAQVVATGTAVVAVHPRPRPAAPHPPLVVLPVRP